MRKFLLSALAIASVTVSFAAPSQAGGYYGGDSYDYQQVCRFKKVKVYDGYGYVHFEKVKVCR